MPVVLRSRKSIRDPDPDSDSSEGRRRSSRRQGSGQPRYREEEEEHDSDSDSGLNLDLESREKEGAGAEEPGGMDLRSCSVFLSRLDTARSDPSDDMNRRSGIPKPASRIPTFHKKTPAPDPSRTRAVEVRESSLPMPSVRFTGSDLPPDLTPDLTQVTQVTQVTRSLLLERHVTVSPRPAIRHDRELNLRLPGLTQTGIGLEEETKDEEVEEEETLGNQSSEEDTEDRREAGERGDGMRPEDRREEEEEEEKEEEEEEEEDKEEEGTRSDQPEEEGIIQEPPPWENQTTVTRTREDVCSWTEQESEEEPLLQSENIESIEPEQQTEAEAAPCAQEDMPHTQTLERGGCCSLLLRGLLPLLLLLVGGLCQHLWMYGLPRSVEQLGAQLELHWLEGLIPESVPCSSDCRVSLVESIPVGLYPSVPAPRESIAQSWLRLLDRANHSADIAAFYVTLRSPDQDPTDAQGRLVFEKLKTLKSKGVNLRVAVNAPQNSGTDTLELEMAGAEVREVDLTALTGGIIHTKLWTLDQTHLYLGSANMDWRSLSQVKEVGVAVEDCSCLAQDVSRVFEVYWSVGGANGSLPPYWPARLSALSSSQNPLHLKLNGVPARVYLSSAPPQLSTRGRTDDLAAILSVIEDAQQFIHVSVMDFIPQALFSQPPRFWPVLDSALRDAACSRRLQVRLLVSCWPQAKAAMFVYLQSMLVLNRAPLHCDIQVKVFSVPSTPEQMLIPFARVNHAKYMVTDRAVYIGTSNWSQDYFTQTAGVGLVVNQTGSEPGPGLETLQSQADQLFLRDWTSQYASDLTVDQTDACPQART